MLCRRCVAERQDDIRELARKWHRVEGDKKDPNCEHEWKHPWFGRWYCPKCGAEFNLTCGCGGSAFVCGAHHAEFVEVMIKECGSVEAFLEERSW
jgi:hypothetical protein